MKKPQKLEIRSDHSFTTKPKKSIRIIIYGVPVEIEGSMELLL